MLLKINIRKSKTKICNTSILTTGMFFNFSNFLNGAINNLNVLQGFAATH